MTKCPLLVTIALLLCYDFLKCLLKMSGDNDYEIPETGAVFTFGRSRFAENLPSHFFVRNDPVFEISCGDDHTALVCKSGRVFLFGRNDCGQLGFGHKKDMSKPSCLKYLKPFHSVHVACGKGHTIISTACNRIFTFGSNSDGQLGVGDLIDRTVPQMVQTNLLDGDNISAVSAGCHHSGFLTEKGEIYLWGSNSDGQCGVENDSYLVTPRKIEFDEPINSLSCGYYHTAFTSLGCVYTFGEEDNGKLGRKRSSRIAPEKVEMKENCVLVKCGGSHTMILTKEGAVFGFGSNFSGQLGIRNIEAECLTPTRLEFPNGNVNIVNLSCGESHSAFLTEEGFLYTCGDSRYGKLCNEDDSTNLMTPTLIHSLENYFSSSVSCGGCHTMVLAKVRHSGDSAGNKRDTLPPLKTKKDFAENSHSENDPNVSNDSKELNASAKYESDGCDSKSNTESNLISEEITHLDDIYTEIEEIKTEKNNVQTKIGEFNTNFSNESFESNENDIVVQESAIKKLLKVFKRKKTLNAILLNEKPAQKNNEETKADELLQVGNQNSSKTCIIL